MGKSGVHDGVDLRGQRALRGLAKPPQRRGFRRMGLLRYHRAEGRLGIGFLVETRDQQAQAHLAAYPGPLPHRHEQLAGGLARHLGQPGGERDPVLGRKLVR